MLFTAGYTGPTGGTGFTGSTGGTGYTGATGGTGFTGSTGESQPKYHMLQPCKTFARLLKIFFIEGGVSAALRHLALTFFSIDDGYDAALHFQCHCRLNWFHRRDWRHWLHWRHWCANSILVLLHC